MNIKYLKDEKTTKLFTRYNRNTTRSRNILKENLEYKLLYGQYTRIPQYDIL